MESDDAPILKQPASHDKRPTKWANLAMYAEPLELGFSLPDDFPSSWIAVAPIPRGKRCLAVAYKNAPSGSTLF